MKSVLLSIQPKWCELIASGKKTVEVRKTRPKLETPFKCYIYCTKAQFFLYKSKATGKIILTASRYTNSILRNNHYGFNGKVIGEFVCDTFVTDRTFGHDALFNAAAVYCVNKELYGWHISELVIYDKPRELSEFHREEYCYPCISPIIRPIKRPPQSWCYVERGGAE